MRRTYEVHAYEGHAYEVHAYEVHAYEVHAYEVHAYEEHAWRLHSKLSTESSQHLISHEILPLQLLFLELPHHKDLYIFLAACC